MPVEDVFSIAGRGTVVTGRVEQGIVKVGDEVSFIGRRLFLFWPRLVWLDVSWVLRPVLLLSGFTRSLYLLGCDVMAGDRGVILRGISTCLSTLVFCLFGWCKEATQLPCLSIHHRTLKQSFCPLNLSPRMYALTRDAF